MLRDDIELLFKKLNPEIETKLNLQKKHILHFYDIRHKIKTDQFNNKDIFDISSEFEKSIEISNFKISRIIDKIVFISGIQKDRFIKLFTLEDSENVNKAITAINETNKLDKNIEKQNKQIYKNLKLKIIKTENDISFLDKIRNFKFRIIKKF